MKRIQRARNSISRVLVITGIALLLFAILWWVLAVKRLVRYPSDVGLAVVVEGSVKRAADRHGLLKYDPPQEADFKLSRALASIDEGYTSNEAAVSEAVTCDTESLPGGINLDDRNVYVFDRGDCINRQSPLSTSSGFPVDRSGSWSVNFPLGADKKSYNVFNNDVASSFAGSFSKEGTVNGVKVYLYEGSFRSRPMVDYRVKARGLPLTTTFGDIKKELEASGVPINSLLQMASGTLTEKEKEKIESFPDDLAIGLEYMVEYKWKAAVEPVTGTIVDVKDDETRISVNTDVKTLLPLFEVLANHAEDPLVVRYLSQLDQQKVLEPREIYRISTGWERDSVAAMADYAGGRIGPIRFTKGYMTYLFLILGAVMVIVGLVLRRERYLHLPGRGSVAQEDAEKRGDAVAP